MSKRLLFIYNPFSGRKLIRSKLYDIVNIFAEAGYEIEIHPTQSHQDAMRMACECADRFDRIVCSGGDGTLDEVVTGVVQSGSKVPIGYIPAGSTNDFGNTLGIPKDMIKAAKIAVSDDLFECDYGKLNDAIFVYVAAFGLFTDTSYNTPQEMKNFWGHFAYVLEGMKTLHEISSYNMRLECSERIIQDRFIFGMVTNSASVGGFKGITGTDVDLSDGVFEVTLVRTPNNVVELNRIITALTTKKEDSDLVFSFKTDKLKCIFDEDVAWTIDGEYAGKNMLFDIENVQHGFTILRES